MLVGDITLLKRLQFAIYRRQQTEQYGNTMRKRPTTLQFYYVNTVVKSGVKYIPLLRFQTWNHYELQKGTSVY